MNKLFYVGFLLLFSARLCAQTNGDVSLLQAKYIEESSTYKIKALQPKRFKTINYINPVFWVFKGAMSLYQHGLSPQIAAQCAYSLSCSNFSKSVIHEHGLLMGVLLSSDRLMRCNGKASVEYPDFLFDTTCDKVIDEAAFYHLN